MADLTRDGLNNQRREISVAVSETVLAEQNTLFNLPKRSLVLGVSAIVTYADSTAGARINVKVGGTVVATDLIVDAEKVVSASDQFYFATGGAVRVLSGSTAPQGDGEFRLVVQYIELDKVNGEYTN